MENIVINLDNDVKIEVSIDKIEVIISDDDRSQYLKEIADWFKQDPNNLLDTFISLQASDKIIKIRKELEAAEKSRQFEIKYPLRGPNYKLRYEFIKDEFSLRVNANIREHTYDPGADDYSDRGPMIDLYHFTKNGKKESLRWDETINKKFNRWVSLKKLGV